MTTNLQTYLTCITCEQTIDKCKCNDMDERLRELFGDPHILFHVCILCLRHFTRCKCKAPLFTTSDDFKIMNRNN